MFSVSHLGGVMDALLVTFCLHFQVNSRNRNVIEAQYFHMLLLKFALFLPGKERLLSSTLI
jgi:hypothetical protein